MRTMADDDELLRIRESVILPLVLTAFDRDCRLIAAAVKTPGPYVDTIQRAMDRITADLTRHRRYFRTHGIKLFDPEWTAQGIETGYLYKKYERKFVMLTETLRVDAELYMRKYLGENIVRFLRMDLPDHLQVLHLDRAWED
ncbi:hypothetical protein O9H85_31415 [Paenibacillus filicis]|uniref:Uncharacterized protein n=1 Tax=Paenibacillus gyeongsangnamensis TaxID=3388067 RepID=A0ABT4QIT7_9BACL|nr:hypothetical protein [Paenibacillus filicis]MCZ8516796.1 hypothetical protein [Paenibacillus filicis]